LKSDKQIISDRQKKTSIKGTVGEYEAIAKLTKEGYFVAKSVDPVLLILLSLIKMVKYS
jgi:hypothetical protein